MYTIYCLFTSLSPAMSPYKRNFQCDFSSIIFFSFSAYCRYHHRVFGVYPEFVLFNFSSLDVRTGEGACQGSERSGQVLRNAGYRPAGAGLFGRRSGPPADGHGSTAGAAARCPRRTGAQGSHRPPVRPAIPSGSPPIRPEIYRKMIREKHLQH